VFDGVSKRAVVLPKVTLTRNDQNLECCWNKHRAVEQSRLPWIVLLDSDNVITTKFLDALYAVPDWDSEMLYVPTWAMPSLDYRAYAGEVVTRDNAVQYVDRPLFLTALNTGNFFVHRESYLAVASRARMRPLGADALYFTYRWLASGRRIFFTPDLHYGHLVHSGNWVKHAEEAQRTIQMLSIKIKNSEWDDA